MTYYEARKKINKLKDKVADEKDREALRIAANLLLDRYDSVGPYYDGEEFTCPKCRNHVAPDDLYCSHCAIALDFDSAEWRTI